MDYWLLGQAMEYRGKGVLDAWARTQTSGDLVRLAEQACDILDAVETSFRALRESEGNDGDLARWLAKHYVLMADVHAIAGGEEP